MDFVIIRNDLGQDASVITGSLNGRAVSGQGFQVSDGSRNGIWYFQVWNLVGDWYIGGFRYYGNDTRQWENDISGYERIYMCMKGSLAWPSGSGLFAWLPYDVVSIAVPNIGFR